MNLDGSKVTMGFFEQMTTGNNPKSVVRVTKMGDGDSAKYPPGHSRHIKVGNVYQGLLLRPVKVGESFYVDYPNAPNHMHTSVVQEILSENTFRTMNSIYKWEIIS